MTAERSKKRDSHSGDRTLLPARLVILGANVANRRRILGIEQNDFAKRINVNAEIFRKFEVGRKHLPKETMVRIAEELNCKVLELYGMH